MSRAPGRSAEIPRESQGIAGKYRENRKFLAISLKPLKISKKKGASQEKDALWEEKIKKTLEFVEEKRKSREFFEKTEDLSRVPAKIPEETLKLVGNREVLRSDELFSVKKAENLRKSQRIPEFFSTMQTELSASSPYNSIFQGNSL